MDKRAPSRKRPSDEPEARQARYKHWKETGATIKGKINFNFSDEEERQELMKKVNDIKVLMGEGTSKVTTYQMLHQVCDFYLSCNSGENGEKVLTNHCHLCQNTRALIKKIP